jgi:hypothetical protein
VEYYKGKYEELKKTSDDQIKENDKMRDKITTSKNLKENFVS